MRKPTESLAFKIARVLITAGLCLFAAWTIFVSGGEVTMLTIALSALLSAATLLADMLKQEKASSVFLILTVMSLATCVWLALAQIPKG